MLIQHKHIGGLHFLRIGRLQLTWSWRGDSPQRAKRVSPRRTKPLSIAAIHKQVNRDLEMLRHG
jgi:hypothetical protein